ncbi:MAG TPA: PEP-CTERM sorting domain-containing protein [Telluria sp.]|jgi:hypothetical protein
MAVKHMVFAGLVATASLAQAGVIDAGSTPSAPRPAWSFNSVSMPAAADQAQTLVLNGPGTWTTYSRYGDRGGSTTLFTGYGPGTAKLTATPAPFTNGPADTSQLGNGGVTGGPSAPPPFTDIAHGGGNGANDVPVATPPASDIVDVIVTTPPDVPQADVPAVPAVVPEPATGMLMLAGMLGAGALSRRRRK